MTTTYDIATMWLRAVGAPQSESMKRAVSIWLAYESGGNVTGNNPWNMHSGPDCTSASHYCPGQGNLPGQIGNRYAGPGDRNVAVFGTLQDGVNANAARLTILSHSGYGYDKILTEARQGNAVGFLDAVQRSSWSAGHYNYRTLLQAFTSASSFNRSVNVKAVAGGSSGTGTPVPSTYSGPTLADAIGSNVKLTSPDVIRQIASQVVAQYGSNDGGVTKLGGYTAGQMGAYLIDFVGKDAKDVPFNFPGVKGYDATKNADASAPSAQDPVTALGGAIGNLGDALTKLAGFTFGLVLIIIGVMIYLRGARQNVVTQEGAPVA